MKKHFRLDKSVKGAADDVHREIDLHIELRAREFEAQGMSPDDARQAALAAFGDPRSVEAEVTSLRLATVRERERRAWIADTVQDVVVAMRGLVRTPAFTIIALLTLALGIGANTAIFSVVQPILLRDLPYPAADQLVQVWTDHRSLGRAEPEWLTPPDFEDWRRDNQTFSALTAYQGWGPDLTGQGDPISLNGLAASGNFLEMLGARPAAGRLLTMADDDAGAEPAVVLSHALWMTRFGGDSSIVGRLITLNGDAWRVVGITDASFRAPVVGPADVIRTMRRPPTDGCGRGCIVLRSIGRLKPGVSVAQAQQDLQRLATKQAQDFPDTNAGVGAWLIPLHDQLTGDVRPALLALGAAVGFVLLIACVNLANLLLVRGAGRARELSVRASLGAGRGRIIRQLLVESAVLAIAGGALGLIVGSVGSRLLIQLIPDSVTQINNVGMDRTTVLFTVGLTFLAAALFGLLPSLNAARADLMSTLRSGSRDIGGQSGGLRRTLVVSELALAVVLLVAAGLLMQSFLSLRRVELGFRADEALITPVFFPRSRYQEPMRAVLAVEQLLERLRANPAIRSAEGADIVPLGGGGDQDMTAIAIGEPPRAGGQSALWYRSITPGYMNALGMRLIAGRQFNAEDRRGSAPVVIVNEEAARQLWGTKDPIGRVIATSPDPADPRPTVIGVVANVRHDGPNEAYKPEMFLPLGQFPNRFVSVVISSAVGLDATTAIVREALSEIDPLLPLTPPVSLSARAGETVALPKLYATLVGVFAASALLLAMIGVYGVMAYAVSQRQREIGVRLAMGADPSAIRRLVLSEGGRLALMGIAVGALLAIGAARLLSALLFGVGAFDLTTFVVVTVLLASMALLASWLPAQRAMRINPLDAMRET